jgi:hypothetical protein
MPDTTNTTKSTPFFDKQAVDFLSGFIAGTFCAGAFHPIDRALYLSISEERPFFSRLNFIHPYHGLTQTLLQRAVIGSSYYIVQAKMNAFITANLPVNDFAQRGLIGLSAGASYGLMTNAAAMVRAHMWGNSSRTFVRSFKEIVSSQGWQALGRGQKASLARDISHGSTYEILRHQFHKTSNAYLAPQFYAEHQNSIHFFNNCFAACIGTILASPFNYARAKQFATPAKETPVSVSHILQGVLKEASGYRSTTARLLFFQQKLRIGIGTGRSALGMAVGQEIFDRTRSLLSDKIEEYSRPAQGR